MTVSPLTLPDLPDPPVGQRGWPWTEAPPPSLWDSRGSEYWPPIGIVTPSRNQGNYLEATLRSVLLQGYPALEYYVEDGASQDNSVSILEKYGPFLSGWTSRIDCGQGHAINRGMRKFKRARWVNWLNSDDILLPGALLAVGESAREQQAAVAIVGGGVACDRKGRRKWIKRPRPDLTGETVRLWRTHEFFQPACFFCKRTFDELGGLDESLTYALDFDLWVRLGEVGTFARLNRFLTQVLVHPKAKTQVALGECLGETVEVLFRRGYNAEAKQLVKEVHEELERVLRPIKPITENMLYQRLLRPVLRRFFGSQYFRD